MLKAPRSWPPKYLRRPVDNKSRVVAIDIDLRKCHAWVDDVEGTTGKVFYKESDVVQLMQALILVRPDVILIEVASPLMYGDKLFRKTLSC